MLFYGKINFSLLIFQRWLLQEKSHPIKKTFATQLVFPIYFLHDCQLCGCFHFTSCTLAKRWCIHQPVNVYTNCLKRYLKCGWLYHSQHDMFKKHGFELKFFYSIFLKLNQIKINKAGVKLQAYVTLHYSVFLVSKVKFDETYMKMSIYENSLFPCSLHSTVNLPAWRPKPKKFSVYSLKQLLSKEKVFYQNYVTNDEI